MRFPAHTIFAAKMRLLTQLEKIHELEFGLLTSSSIRVFKFSMSFDSNPNRLIVILIS